MRPDGGSRFFVQTTEQVIPTITATAERVEIAFHRTSVHLANSRRWLDTQHFNTPARRARLERRGRDWALVIYLRAASTPVVTSHSGDDGYYFTYIDFPAGQWNDHASPLSSMRIQLSDTSRTDMTRSESGASVDSESATRSPATPIADSEVPPAFQDEP